VTIDADEDVSAGVVVSTGTTSGMLISGGPLDVDATGAVMLDATAASNFNVAGAGIDITVESEEGSIVIKADEAVAGAVTIDADEDGATGVVISVGASSELFVTGGLTDIGGGLCVSAGGDNDLCVAADFEVEGTTYIGTTALSGTLTINAGAKINSASVTTGTHGVVFNCSGSHSHADVEDPVSICSIPANANVVDVVYSITEVWNDGSASAVNCGIKNGDTDAFVAAMDLQAATDVTRMGADGDMVYLTSFIDVGASDVDVQCTVAETDGDANTGAATLIIYYIID